MFKCKIIIIHYLLFIRNVFYKLFSQAKSVFFYNVQIMCICNIQLFLETRLKSCRYIHEAILIRHICNVYDAFNSQTFNSLTICAAMTALYANLSHHNKPLANDVTNGLMAPNVCVSAPSDVCLI